MEIENRMSLLWRKADDKGLMHYQVYKLLHSLGWQAYLHDYNPNAEWGNRQRKKINEEAIEQALIAIDYMI